MTDNVQRDGLQVLLEHLRRHLLEAQVHLDIWSLLRSEEYQDVVQMYAGFFIPTQHAHLRGFYVTLGVVIDDRDSSQPSLTKALNVLESNPSLAAVDVNEVKLQIAAYRASIEKVKTFRDKRVAHWDSGPEPIPPEEKEVRELLKELQKGFNRIFGGMNPGETWSFTLLGLDNSKQALDILKWHTENIMALHMLKFRLRRDALQEDMGKLKHDIEELDALLP